MKKNYLFVIIPGKTATSLIRYQVICRKTRYRNINIIYILFGDAIFTNMSPKFLCISVPESFKSENLLPNQQQNPIKIIYIFFFFNNFFSFNIKTYLKINNKNKWWRQYRPNKYKGIKYVENILPKYHYFSGHHLFISNYIHFINFDFILIFHIIRRGGTGPTTSYIPYKITIICSK